MSLGSRINEIRREKKLSIDDLCAKSGIPKGTLSKITAGITTSPTLDTVKAIAAALDCRLDDLDDVQNGDSLSESEDAHIKKYRALDDYGKEAVDGVLDVEYRRLEAERRASAAAKIKEQRQEMEAAEESTPELVYFTIPRQLYAMGAGGGQYNDYQSTENQRLIKEPPRGTSYIAPVSGDSMEPTFHDGDLLFVRATVDIRPGQIGVFFMGGQQWVKECGDGELISHNPTYDPEPFTEDVRCQGIVLGVCDDSYFEK